MNDRYRGDEGLPNDGGHSFDGLSRFREWDSCEGSAAMAKRIIYAVGAEVSIERPKLSFAEQLALVASGKARVVPVIPIRKPDPDRTLGGVCWL